MVLDIPLIKMETGGLGNGLTVKEQMVFKDTKNTAKKTIEVHLIAKANITVKESV